MTATRLVLASASPRRRDLLSDLGLAFEVRPTDVDETPYEGEPPDALVRRLATAKATAAGAAGELVLAADTVVSLGARVLGKPASAGEAREMLRSLSGRTHTVSTGVAARLVDGTTNGAVVVVTTDVTFVDIDPADLDWYVRTGEPLDKAGAYGLQGLGARFVRRIDGSPTNVIGLPLAETAELVAGLGVDLLDFRADLLDFRAD
jgi:septum formation protein